MADGGRLASAQARAGLKPREPRIRTKGATARKFFRLHGMDGMDGVTPDGAGDRLHELGWGRAAQETRAFLSTTMSTHGRRRGAGRAVAATRKGLPARQRLLYFPLNPAAARGRRAVSSGPLGMAALGARWRAAGLRILLYCRAIPAQSLVIAGSPKSAGVAPSLRGFSAETAHARRRFTAHEKTGMDGTSAEP